MMTNAELAILSLITEEPRHGYQVEQVIEERDMRRWTEVGFSSIYRILNKLEKDGLVEGRPGEPQGRGPARKVYHMTPAGWDAWREASLEALSTPRITSSTFLLGLDNLYNLDPDEALRALGDYRRSLSLSRDALIEHLAGRGPMHFYMQAFFDYLVSMMKAEIEWLDKFITQMEAYKNEKEHTK